jgi:ankyrin repeat protein
MSVEHKHAASIDGRADANTNAAAERVPPSLLAPVQRGNLPHVLRELEGTFPHAQLDEQDKDGRTPLMICAITGREEIASALIDAGAELDKRDRFGWTAAMLAGIRGFNGIVRMLVQHGCSVHLGRSREHIDAHTATSLQTTFASVEGRTAEYARSSMVCCVGKPVRSNRVLRVPYTDAVFSLGQDSGTLPEGLTLDAQTGDIGGSPTAPTTPPPPTQTRGDGGQQRGVAVAVVRVKCADRHMPSAFVWLEVRVSVCVGVSAAEEQKLGARAVVACKAGREEVARGLLFAGADVCAGGGHAESLLHAAVSMGSESLLREALEAGAHHHRPRRGNRKPATSFVDVRDRHGRTPLILSCILQCSEMARMLLSFGAGVDETDAFGRTGLMICVAAGSAVLARVLLDHGASVEATKGPSGQSVVDIAQQSGFRLVLELVRQVQRSAAHATRPAEHKIMTKSIQELPPSSSSSFSSQGGRVRMCTECMFV